MRQDEVRNDLLLLLMKGLRYHSVVCLFFNLASPKTLRLDLMLLLLYVPLLLFAVIRRKCGNIFLFLLFHILVSGAFVVVFPEWEQRIVIGGCVCIMAVSSVYARITAGNEKEECPPVPSLAVFVIVFLAAWQSERVQVMQISCYEAFLFLVIFVIHRNLENLAKFLNENETMENFPGDQIKAMNYLLLGVFVLFFMAGMLFLREPFRHLFLAAGTICRLLLRMIVKILSWFFQNDVQQPESLGQDIAQGSMPELEAGETSALAQLLEEFMVAGAGIVLAVAAVYMLARYLYGIYQKFYEQHKEPDDESEFIWKNKDQREKFIRKIKKPSVFQFASPDQKIRRLYKKSIQKRFRSKEIIPVEMTPMELESLAAGYSDQLQLMKTRSETEGMGESRVQEDYIINRKISLYEKARYSQHNCDKNEVEQMKQYIKEDY